IFYISILYYGKTPDNYLELLLILFAFVNINYNFKDSYTINIKPTSINYVTWIILVLYLKIKTVFLLMSLLLLIVLYILSILLKTIMLLCINNAFLIYYFDLPVDIV